MALLKNLTRKVGRLPSVAFTYSTIVWRYLLYVVSCRKFYSGSLHEFSQLLVFSSRLRSLPGMTSVEERAYFQWYAQHIFEGSGAIVDLGCWLGSTTIPLAVGLENNPKVSGSKKLLHAYDEFIWRTYMEDCVVGTPLQSKLEEGKSFLPEFNKRIDPWKDRVKVHVADLSTEIWNGETIEFLLIDAMKSWELTNNIIQKFFPALVPGKSFILHQDFAHWFTPWIHLTNFRFRDYFEFAYQVPMSSSVVFKLSRAIPSELLSSTFALSSFSSDEIEAAFAYSLSLVSGKKRSNVAAAKVMTFVYLGAWQEARQELERFRSQGLSFDSDLSSVENRISAHETAIQ